MKGRIAWNKGLRLTDEHKKKISEALKGHAAWGKGLTKETDPRVKAISDAMKGRVSPFRGQHQSVEARRKISTALKGKPTWSKGLTKEIDPRLKALGKKISFTNKGKVSWSKGLTKETEPSLKAISEKLKGRLISEQTRKNMSDAMKGREAWIKGKHWSEEIKRRMSISARGKHYASPETRRKLRETHLGAKSPLYIDGRNKLYDQYRGDNWAKIRKQALERDEHKCDFCNTGECSGRLIVHHLDPYHDSHNNKLSNLITLCNHHHQIVEHNGKEELFVMGIASLQK